MIQYIASDLDGTLLQNNASKLNPVIFEQIRKLKEKGILFIAGCFSVTNRVRPEKSGILLCRTILRSNS